VLSGIYKNKRGHHVRKFFLLSLLTLVAVPAASEAAPIYVEGNTCPAAVVNPYNRQYSVDQALRCMFETEFSGQLANPQGDDAEADYWLNSAAADAAGWGTAALEDDWQGLGSNVIDGFSYTKDAGNDDGIFTFSDSLLDEYDQFALAMKDGAKPKFAIFMLPVGLTTGNWHFLTTQGELSHFALYGRNLLEINEECPNPPCDPDITEVPEPATLLLIGSGLTFAARWRRARR
jgi:PEP-CTERM motif